ncbi:hypothetical protein D1122_21685 [Cereibacter sphaeroides]|uniref:ATP-dependent nuclease n=1 Tax=Cereibacter sphaeroides TaxID=1063 RepID=UPI000E5BA45A|nr:AAA family ATPase [Cereibacter sphaeroides]RHZ91063.1 hypothetical protein D1122_21685 [Cereibacter sphaeroides]
MREAKINDYYRRLTERDAVWSTRIERVQINSFRGIRDLEIIPAPNITVLVGANGSGKSRVIAAIYQALTGSVSAEAVAVSVRQLRQAPGDIPVTLINGAEKVEVYQSYFRTIRDIESNILNGVDPLELSSAQLAEVNYLLCRNYSAVSAYEVEPGIRITSESDTEGQFSSESVPFFKVKGDGAEWDTTQMGSGEYAVLYLWWALGLRDAGSIVLLEEPETYLSYVVQERMANHLAKICFDKRLTIVMSTHSFPFIAKLPERSVVPLLKKGNGSAIARKGKHEIISRIGAPIYLRTVIVVEDELARFIIEEFLKVYFPSVHGRVVVRAVLGRPPGKTGGATGIRALLDSVRHVDEFPIEIAAAYDADQENDVNFTDERIRQFQRILIPSDRPMDAVFVELCRKHLEEIRALCPRFPDEFDKAEGSDHHDHIRSASAGAGVDLSFIRTMCFGWWTTEFPESTEKLRQDMLQLLETTGALSG